MPERERLKVWLLCLSANHCPVHTVTVSVVRGRLVLTGHTWTDMSAKACRSLSILFWSYLFEDRLFFFCTCFESIKCRIVEKIKGYFNKWNPGFLQACLGGIAHASPTDTCARHNRGEINKSKCKQLQTHMLHTLSIYSMTSTNRKQKVALSLRTGGLAASFASLDVHGPPESRGYCF